MDAYFECQPDKYDTDKLKILFTISRFTKGPAKYWAETFLAKREEKMTAAGGFDTWTKFKTAVLKHFGDEDLSDEANRNINRL